MVAKIFLNACEQSVVKISGVRGVPEWLLPFPLPLLPAAYIMYVYSEVSATVLNEAYQISMSLAAIICILLGNQPH